MEIVAYGTSSSSQSYGFNSAAEVTEAVFIRNARFINFIFDTFRIDTNVA